MGNPFQDQLLKAGLVNKKQVNKLKHEQRINRQQNTVESPSDESIKAKQEQLAMKSVTENSIASTMKRCVNVKNWHRLNR